MYYSFLVFALLVARVLAVLDINDCPNAVGICYSVWHSIGHEKGTTPPDITEIENGHGNFAGKQAWHHWGRPDGGYYRGSNKTVLRRHFKQITDAKIDFIVIDATNLEGYGGYQPGLFSGPTDSLLAEMKQQRDAGQPTPHVVFWVRTASDDDDPSAVGRFVKQRYYTRPEYDDLWMHYGGKPLLLTTDTRPEKFLDFFTVRKMWGLQGTLSTGEWSFLQDAPQNVGISYLGQPEQISVSTAKQAGYMTDKKTATPRKYGLTYQQQWKRAFEVHPKVVMLTWWNEWMAQRQENDAAEYSRDIEPQDPNQKDSHGSLYYEWTKLYVGAYKANRPLPKTLVRANGHY